MPARGFAADRTSRSVSRLRLWALLALLVVGAGCGGNSEPPPVEVSDVGGSPVASLHEDLFSLGERDLATSVAEAAEMGAAVLRVDLRWDQVAPVRPAVADDPTDPAYVWGIYDPLVDAAEASGVELLIAVYGTPGWAADVEVAAGAPQSWAVRPKRAADFADFATAAARRFGSRGVRRWEAWNEPNIPIFLYPQYERRGGEWVAVSPATYSDLLTAFHAAVKAVSPDAIVAGGVTAPAGDACGGRCPVGEGEPTRVRPDAFWRALAAPGLQPPMDVVSHHPYPITRPRDATPPGRSYIDLYNLDVLVRTIDAGYLRGKRVWVTEYGFGTEPVKEYRTAFTREEQADYIADAFSRLRANRRVDLVTYYVSRDHQGWRSGLVDLQGNPKPGRDAFAMPLTATPATVPAAGSQVRLVGQARPATGATTVDLQFREGGDWAPLTSVRTTRDGTFAVTITVTGPMEVRSTWTGRTRTGAERTWTGWPVKIAVGATTSDG